MEEDELKRMAEDYEYGVARARSDGLSPEQRSEMAAAWARANVEMQEIRRKVREILVPADVCRIEYPAYYSFALQIYGLLGKYGGGNAVIAEVAGLINLWHERGLDEALLRRIREEVFGLPGN